MFIDVMFQGIDFRIEHKRIDLIYAGQIKEPKCNI